ncbi:MAG: hypothetical protein ACTHMC_28900 [Pseudobacter sp.]|uniref:hypothetical protein n=1 Tax=Pseudobacter sp. TaxID=2045420 RepID=UPI003F7F5AB5
MKRFTIQTVAIIIAISLSSFSHTKSLSKHKKKYFEGTWFKYVGPCFPGTASLTDIRNPINYVKATIPDVLLCDDLNYLCAIHAIENSNTNRPFIRIIDQIYTDLASYYSSPSTNFAGIIEKTECSD